MIYLLSLLTAIQVWDVHTTSDAMKRGYGREAWGPMKWLNRLHEDAAFWSLLAIKVALCVTLWIVRPPEIVLIGLIVFYVVFVVIGNTKLWYNFHWRKHE